MAVEKARLAAPHQRRARPELPVTAPRPPAHLDSTVELRHCAAPPHHAGVDCVEAPVVLAADEDNLPRAGQLQCRVQPVRQAGKRADLLQDMIFIFFSTKATNSKIKLNRIK